MLSTTQTITIIGVNTNINSTILCNGNSTGSITANAFGGNGNYNYSWNTTPTQNTATINNLNAGSYTVNVTNTNACSISKTVVLNEPTALNATALIKPNICNNSNGSIQLTVAGGKTPYQFAWSNNASTNPVMNLATGNYTVTLTDSNACTLSLTNLIIKDSSNNIQIYLGKDTAFCPGNQLILNPGNFEHYEWQDLSKQPTFIVSQTGTYSVTVTDKDGCKAFDAIEITVDCKDVYFPTAFTPNGDGKNDFFGAIGNINALTFYQLFVYNRNGELIFSSSNSSKKWDGTIKGKKLDNGSYTWYASYSINNQPLQMQKGTIILLK